MLVVAAASLEALVQCCLLPDITVYRLDNKYFFRICNVLPFSCTHLALWRGKEEGLKLWLFIWEERKLDFTKGVSLFQLKSM